MLGTCADTDTGTMERGSKQTLDVSSHTGGKYQFGCVHRQTIVQELCENRGGRPGLSVLTSLLVSVDVKNY